MSVQGLMHGLMLDHLPPGAQHDDVIILTRGSDVLIPDPEPRWPGQAQAEAAVWGSEEVLAKESAMTPLRERVAAVLEAADLLGAPSASNGSAGSPQPSWGRLAEILKCLQAYDRLPSTIGQDDVDLVVAHGAWRWFTLLSPRHGVACTASAPAARALLDACAHSIDRAVADGPAIRIYSCHDSTLIGLIQALGLQGESWPAYATTMKLDLLEDDGAAASPRWWLRASLNGDPLEWTGQAGHAAEEDGLVPLEAVQDAMANAFPSAGGGFERLWGAAGEGSTGAGDGGEGDSERLALPDGDGRPQVEVGGPATALDELGPVVVNKEMSEDEQEATKRMVGAQNLKRVVALKANSSDYYTV